MAVGQKLSWPVLKAYELISVGPTAGAALVKSGQLKTFLIGARRYVTDAELQRFLAQRMRDSAGEAIARRTDEATAASLRVRAERRFKKPAVSA